jgi:hypothetical protein
MSRQKENDDVDFLAKKNGGELAARELNQDVSGKCLKCVSNETDRDTNETWAK